MLQELPEDLFHPQCSQVRVGQSCISLPCYLQGIRQDSLCPGAAPSCSLAAPGTSSQSWALPQPCVEEMGTLLQQERAPPRASLAIAPESAWPLLNPAKEATRLS